MPAFDAIAAGYDRQFSDTTVGRLQRAVVYRYLAPYTGTGVSVLELNCGTGEDACWLAERGCRVLATDISPNMVARTAEKAGQAGLSALIRTQVLDMRTLESANLPETFDLVLSNFGGLNCLSPEDMRRFGAALPALLRPGGRFVAVVMGRFCGWESLYFLLKGQPRAAFRRWSVQPVEAPLDADTRLPVWYYGPYVFEKFFPALARRTVQPVGCWLPPSYLDPWFSRRPQGLEGLNFLEKKCRGRLWAAAADHFLLVLEKS